MCDVVKRYNELFQEILLGVKEKYIQAYPDESKTLKFYCFDPEEKKLDIFSYDQKVREASDKCLEYYWIELECGGQEYKISMFYKDFDYGRGNVHVIPGVIQFWKKINEEINISISDLHIHSQVKAYVECGWKPVLEDPSFWDMNQIYLKRKIDEKEEITKEKNKNYIKEIVKIVFNTWEESQVGKEKIEKIDYKDLTIECRCFFEKITECHINLLNTQKQEGVTGKISGGRNINYKFLKWLNLKNENKMISSYELFEVYGYGYFVLYGKVHIYSLVGSDSPNKYENGKWEIVYPTYVANKQYFIEDVSKKKED